MKETGSRKGNRRGEILRAADKVMRSKGLAGVTTREIARVAGCSEGALYVHFHDRLELLLAMLEDTLPEMLGPLQALGQTVGRGSPHGNLTKAMQGILNFHLQATPMVASLFAEPALHRAYRAALARQKKGPHLSAKALERYIAAEKKGGRIAAHADPRLTAQLLLSASFFRAFCETFFGTRLRPAWPAFVRQILTTLVPTRGH